MELESAGKAAVEGSKGKESKVGGSYSIGVTLKVTFKKAKPASVAATVLAKMKEHQDELRTKIWGAAEPAIAKAFAEDYYKQKQGWIFKSEDRKDAERVAAGMGQEQIRVGEDGEAYEVENQ